jgi:hypothetical protein
VVRDSEGNPVVDESLAVISVEEFSQLQGILDGVKLTRRKR